MALISIVYRRFISSSGLAKNKPNLVHTSRTAFHLVFCSRQLDALTSLAMAAAPTSIRLVADIFNATCLKSRKHSIQAPHPSKCPWETFQCTAQRDATELLKSYR
ncbi:hypothetical protein AVEN_160475-1 [Araneus ventricosus]|uniref:Uncharacterized protein n=1 Tax=Araneus ventricosus TaxID=182803 RepID=A0A4Y2PJ94_ARAVE|nr:hypothetical protein AVEN_160475-1 [Araneus ventricosus]